MLARLLCLCLAAGLSAAEATYRIMAVGDSITQGGGKVFATYRLPLAAKLRAAGLRCEFVGSQKTETAAGSLSHEGHGGKNAEFLASILETRLQAHPADVLMIQAGHNHFAEEKPVPGIVAAHRQMIAIARRLNPKAIVFVAQVTPSGKLPKYAYLPELNAALADLVKELHRPGQPVYLVDLATGFDVGADTISDLVHPNDRGAEKIAQRWAEALQARLR